MIFQKELKRIKKYYSIFRILILINFHDYNEITMLFIYFHQKLFIFMKMYFLWIHDYICCFDNICISASRKYQSAYRILSFFFNTEISVNRMYVHSPITANSVKCVCHRMLFKILNLKINRKSTFKKKNKKSLTFNFLKYV